MYFRQIYYEFEILPVTQGGNTRNCNNQIIPNIPIINNPKNRTNSALKSNLLSTDNKLLFVLKHRMDNFIP